MAVREDPWFKGNYDLGAAMKRFTDDELQRLGVSRDDDHATVLAKIKEEAVAQWTDTEELIELTVEQAAAAIDMYPANRDEALARFYGETMQDIAEEDVDSESVLMAMMMTIFKLAEERRKAAWLMDGNRRAPLKR